MEPKDNSGEDDMDAPGLKYDIQPPNDSADDTGEDDMSGPGMKDNLDHGKANKNPNETLRLLGAGQAYMNKNK